MVEKIKETKDQVLERMDKSIRERGVDRVDVTEMGKLADIVKDLAEAEKACWEAEYYMSVTEAMGDGSMGYDEAMGYAQGGRGGGGGSQGYRRGGRRGYNPNRDSMGRYTSRRGYREARYGHDDMMQDVRAMMQEADPAEREELKRQLRQMTEM